MNMCIQGIRLVTFDATNTLLRFRIYPWQYYSIVARDFGFKGAVDLKPRLLDSYKTMWDKYPNFGKNIISWEEWWKGVVTKTFEGQLQKSADIDGLANKLINDFKTTKCWCLSEGTVKILNMLRSRGICLGVISNFDPRLVEVLQNVHIHDKFNFVLTSFDIGYTKPDKKIFEHALKLQHEKIHPSECLHIGDDVEKDYKAARASGWHAFLVSNKIFIDKSVLMEHIFSNLNELNQAIIENKLML